jgi:antitoxin VapB
MALSIKHPEADRLARELARTTGESLTEAVLKAIRERLIRETGWTPEGARAEIARIQAELAQAPILNDRTPDEIIGYDEHGLPT